MDSKIYDTPAMILAYNAQERLYIPTMPDEIREACHYIGPQLVRALKDPSGTMLVDLCSSFTQLRFTEPIYGSTTTI